MVRKFDSLTPLSSSVSKNCFSSLLQKNSLPLDVETAFVAPCCNYSETWFLLLFTLWFTSVRSRLVYQCSVPFARMH